MPKKEQKNCWLGSPFQKQKHINLIKPKVLSEIDCSVRGPWLDQNDKVPRVLKRKPISLCCAIVSCQTSLRNGSAPDSSPEGCVLKSCRGQARILVQLVSYSCCRVSLMNPRTFLTKTFGKHSNHTYTINLLNLNTHKPT